MRFLNPRQTSCPDGCGFGDHEHLFGTEGLRPASPARALTPAAADESRRATGSAARRPSAPGNTCKPLGQLASCHDAHVLGEVAVSTFAGRVGERFRVQIEGAEQMVLELVEAKEVGRPHRPEARTPFSLVFRGPTEPVLPQRIYAFEHEELGRLEIFIVPIGRDERGTSYEATFT